MAIAPTCSECRATMVAAEAVTGDGQPIGFRRNGWLWDAGVLLCTRCGNVRVRGTNMRHGEAGATPEPQVQGRSEGDPLPAKR